MIPLDGTLTTVLDLWYTKYEDRELTFDVHNIVRPEHVEDWLARQMCIVIFHHGMDKMGHFDNTRTFPLYKLFTMESSVDQSVRVRLTMTQQRSYKPYDTKDLLWKL
jgi:hypothetical protein